jgi:mRNA interferase MazF
LQLGGCGGRQAGLADPPPPLRHHVRTMIVAPLTTRGRPYPTRVPCRFAGVEGLVVLDQLRTTNLSRLVKRLAGSRTKP